MMTFDLPGPNPFFNAFKETLSSKNPPLFGGVITSRLILRHMLGVSVVALVILSSLAQSGVFGVYSNHRTLLTETEIDHVVANVHHTLSEESPMALLFDLPPAHPSHNDVLTMPKDLMKASVQGVSSLSPVPPEPVDEWLFWENHPDDVERLEWPLERYGISSQYGQRGARFHHGMDLTAPIGSTIYSVDSGVVVQSTFEQGYGLVVTIDHGKGMKTKYAHMAKSFVKVGQWIYRHQMVGSVGMTGRTSGPHLHFEVLVYGRSRNPMRYLRGRQQQVAAHKKLSPLYQPI